MVARKAAKCSIQAIEMDSSSEDLEAVDDDSKDCRSMAISAEYLGDQRPAGGHERSSAVPCDAAHGVEGRQRQVELGEPPGALPKGAMTWGDAWRCRIVPSSNPWLHLMVRPSGGQERRG